MTTAFTIISGGRRTVRMADSSCMHCRFTLVAGRDSHTLLLHPIRFRKRRSSSIASAFNASSKANAKVPKKTIFRIKKKLKLI